MAIWWTILSPLVANTVHAYEHMYAKWPASAAAVEQLFMYIICKYVGVGVGAVSARTRYHRWRVESESSPKSISMRLCTALRNARVRKKVYTHVHNK